MNNTLKTFYFDLKHAIDVHDYIIEKSGGVAGYDADKVNILESTLFHIQNDDYYPTFLDKITHLLYSVNKNHAFADGNKRSSLALSAYFLEINGYDYCIIEDIIMGTNSEAIKWALIEILQNETNEY